MYITTTVECFGSGRMFVFSCVFFYLELWAMRKTRFSLIQSLSLWHDPIFCWTFGIFCFRFVYNNATITEKLNCICTLNRTFAELYWCVRVWVCCLHTKMHSKSSKSFTVFFFYYYKYAFFLVLFVYAVTTLVRNWLQLCYKFPRVNSFTFSIRLFRSRFLLDALCLFWAFSFTFIHSIGRRFAQMCIEIWCSRCLNFDSRLVPLFFFVSLNFIALFCVSFGLGFSLSLPLRVCLCRVLFLY